MRASWVGVLACLISTPSWAAGFAVGEQGAAAFGLAGAVTGRLDAPEMGYYNPAAWAFRAEGLTAAVGATAVSPSMRHENPQSGVQTIAQTHTQFPPYAHAAFNFGRFALGATFGVPFGSGLAWPDVPSWGGRFEITAIELTTFELAPSLAVRVWDTVALAAGPRFVSSSVYLARKVDLINSEGSVELGGDSSGVGAQAAVALGPFGPASFGLTYRSRVQLDYAGVANFENIPPEFSPGAKDGDVTTSVTLPDRVALGGAWAFENTRVSADLEYFRWSTFQSLDINFVDDATPDVTQPRNWQDTFAVRVGVEQREIIPGLALRAGMAFDPTPSPTNTLSPSLPDGDRLLFTLGAGYALGSELTLHASYGRVIFLGAESEGDAFAGRYDASANLFSAGLSFSPAGDASGLGALE